MKILPLFSLTWIMFGLALFGLWPASRDARTSETNEPAHPVGENPKELGLIRWNRGLETAVAKAAAGNKPLLMLFQEVPGCATCVGYGNQVLSHPLIVEAVEDLFVPLAVYNNIDGDDRKTLRAFNEPSWNNPVVRILSSGRKELAPRLDGDYTQRGLVRAMTVALENAGKPVPQYLQVLSEELSLLDRPLEKAKFAMYCFWTGEAELGSLKGVLSTRPGFIGGKEVVEVEFDPSLLSYGKLVEEARAQKCATTVFSETAQQLAIAKSIVGSDAVRRGGPIRPDKEPKYYLSKTSLRFLPLTILQKTRINSLLGKGKDPLQVLSPRQIRMFESIKRHPDAGWKNLISDETIEQSWIDVAARVTN